MPTEKSTRLDAVNAVLRAAGETPVASITDESGVDVVQADQTLEEVEREIQSLGWSWNQRYVKYTPDGDSNIRIPVNIVRVDGVRGTQYTVRDGLLFDMRQQTTSPIEFTSAVTLKVTELLDWDNTPQAARQYIAARAARRYVDQTISDPTLSQTATLDEQQAWAILRKDELARANATVFTPQMQRFVDRDSPLNWVC